MDAQEFTTQWDGVQVRVAWDVRITGTIESWYHGTLVVIRLNDGTRQVYPVQQLEPQEVSNEP